MYWVFTWAELFATWSLSFSLAQLTVRHAAFLSQYKAFQHLFSFTCFLHDVGAFIYTSWFLHFPQTSFGHPQVFVSSVMASLVGLCSSLPDVNMAFIYKSIASTSSRALDVFGCFAPLPTRVVPVLMSRMSQIASTAFAFLRNLFSWEIPVASVTVSSNHAIPSYFIVGMKGMGEDWLPDLPQFEGWNFVHAFSSGIPVTSKPSDVDLEVARAFLAKFDPPTQDYSGLLALIALMFLSVVLAFTLLTYKLVNASTRVHPTACFAHGASTSTIMCDQGNCKHNRLPSTSSSIETSHRTDDSADTLVHYSVTRGRALTSLKSVRTGGAESALAVPSIARTMVVKEDEHRGARLTSRRRPTLHASTGFDSKGLRTAPSPSHKLEETRHPPVGLAASKYTTGRINGSGRSRSPSHRSEETRHPLEGLAASERATEYTNDELFSDDLSRETSTTIDPESRTSAMLTRMNTMINAIVTSSPMSALGDASNIKDCLGRNSSPPSTPQRQTFSTTTPSTPRKLRSEYSGWSPSSPGAVERERMWMATLQRSPTPASRRVDDFILTDSIRKMHPWAFSDAGASSSVSPSTNLPSTTPLISSSPSSHPQSSTAGMSTYTTRYIERREDRTRFRLGTPDETRDGTSELPLLAASECTIGHTNNESFGDDVLQETNSAAAPESPTSAALTRMTNMLNAIVTSSSMSSLGDASNIEEGLGPNPSPPSTPQRQTFRTTTPTAPNGPRGEYSGWSSSPTPASRRVDGFILTDSIRKRHPWAFEYAGASSSVSPSTNLPSTTPLISPSSSFHPQSSTAGMTPYTTRYIERREDRISLRPDGPDETRGGTSELPLLAASECTIEHTNDESFGDDVLQETNSAAAPESPTSAALTRMNNIINDIVNSPSTLSLRGASNIEEGLGPNPSPPSPFQWKTFPTAPSTPIRVIDQSTPRITRSVLRECRFVVGPFITVPEELRDEYPGWSPTDPGAVERGRTWMANVWRSPTPASRRVDECVLTDSIRKRHPWAFEYAGASSSLSPSPSVPSTTPLGSPPPSSDLHSSVTGLTPYTTQKERDVDREKTPSLLYDTPGETLGRPFTLSPQTPSSSRPSTKAHVLRSKALVMSTPSSSEKGSVLFSRSTRDAVRYGI